MSELLTITGNLCVVHGYHWPRPTRTVSHHIIPLEFNGPSTKDNRVYVCDTGHYNIHEYINWALGRHENEPRVTRKERALAMQALAVILK